MSTASNTGLYELSMQELDKRSQRSSVSMGRTGTSVTNCSVHVAHRLLQLQVPCPEQVGLQGHVCYKKSTHGDTALQRRQIWLLCS